MGSKVEYEPEHHDSWHPAGSSCHKQPVLQTNGDKLGLRISGQQHRPQTKQSYDVYIFTGRDNNGSMTPPYRLRQMMAYSISASGKNPNPTPRAEPERLVQILHSKCQDLCLGFPPLRTLQIALPIADMATRRRKEGPYARF